MLSTFHSVLIDVCIQTAILIINNVDNHFIVLTPCFVVKDVMDANIEHNNRQMLYDDDHFWLSTVDCCVKKSVDPLSEFLTARKLICYGISFSTFKH